MPEFAALAAAAERAAWDPSYPIPLELKSYEETVQAFFPDSPPDPASPLGAAFLWWSALPNKAEFLPALNALTFDPADWGDYERALQQLDGTGMMQFVDRCPDADDIAYVKFMPNVDHPMRAFGAVPLERAQVLTLVLCPDGWWRAWGLSEDYFPPAARVKFGVEDQ